MMPMWFYTHSGVRYLVLIAAAAAIVYLLVGILRGGQFDKLAKILTAAYVGLLDLQVGFGVVLYLLIPSYPQLLEHVVMALAAVTVAHVANIMNKRRDEPSLGIALAGVVISLILIVGGIWAIGREILGTSVL
ncbi:MAG: hypothetical protein QF680_03165 [Acidobacteriota bacterium]|nr:hypothetical protein [Acidobacteriota bacterium]